MSQTSPVLNMIASIFAIKPNSSQNTNRDHALELLPRCAGQCTYGHCSLLAEPWFTRILSLERKRSERSRKPFLLLLLDLEGAGEVNGGHDRLTHQVLDVVTSFTRETDLAGWYKGVSVLGVIFTEIGSTHQVNHAVQSVGLKISSALERALGSEKASRIHISCHVYPENWEAKGKKPPLDLRLYPDISKRRKSKWMKSAGKRMIDVLGSAMALIGLSPVFLIVSLLVKLTSKGPVLFRQERVGQSGQHFTFLKFRTMQVANNSEIHKEYVKRLIKGKVDASQGVFKIQNDPRVTRIGRILRKTSLDELPQFWNVLCGQMSLVGPRPPLAYEVEVYDIWHRRRLLEAKPGITGLWQVMGRSRTCFDDMVRLDLHYTRASSLWLDLKILLQTPRAVLAGDGAY